MPNVNSDEPALPDIPIKALGHFARSLRDTRQSTPQTLLKIVSKASEMIPAATQASIAILREGTRTIAASTDLLAEELCRRQYESGEGPIATEVHHLDVYRAHEPEVDIDWNYFVSYSLTVGIRSMAAFKLHHGSDDLGALVLYSPASAAFDTQTVAVGEAIAAHATLALLVGRDDQQFRFGLANRDVIGQAKGIIMERYNLDAVESFEVLIDLSQQANRPLHRIARDLVDDSHPTSN